MQNKKIKIIGSLTSPYTRVVRTLCEELSLNYELEMTGPFGKITEAQNKLIKSNNALNRVPILVIEKESLIESRLICTYLLKEYEKNIPKDFMLNEDFSIQEENFISVTHGMLDAGILHFTLSKTNPELDMSKGFFPVIFVRIKDALEWMNLQIAQDSAFLTEKLGIPQITLCSTLEWFTKRNIYDWKSFDKVADLYHRWKDRASLVKTRIPENI